MFKLVVNYDSVIVLGIIAQSDNAITIFINL